MFSPEIEAQAGLHQIRLDAINLTASAFFERYGRTLDSLSRALGAIPGSLSLDAFLDHCFAKAAGTVYNGSGGLPSFALADDAFRVVDSAMAIITRFGVGRDGSPTSQSIQELTLVLRRYLYDDGPPDISALRSLTQSTARGIFNSEIKSCINGPQDPRNVI